MEIWLYENTDMRLQGILVVSRILSFSGIRRVHESGHRQMLRSVGLLHNPQIPEEAKDQEVPRQNPPQER